MAGKDRHVIVRTEVVQRTGNHSEVIRLLARERILDVIFENEVVIIHIEQEV